jgi:xylulokinase
MMRPAAGGDRREARLVARLGAATEGTSMASGERYVLGVDLGTGGPKVVLAGTDGRLLGHEAEKVGVRLLPGGGAEQDPDEWWRAVTVATRRLLARGLAPVGDVAAVCMSSQWGGLVPVDAAGRHLHDALIWMDGRGAEHSRALVGGGVRVPGTGYNARALRHWLRLTGGVPSRTGKDPVGQAQWLRHERPDVYAAAAYLLDVPEYLTMRLSGRAVAGYDTATVRWCTDNRDPSRVRYDPGLVRRCGLDLAKLPGLCPPATVVGVVRPEVAAELGLPDHVQVVAGTGDTTAAAIGAGAVLDYQAHLYVGTSAWLSCHVPFKRTDVLRNIASLPAVVPDRYWIATVQDVAGKAIDWLIDHVVYPDDGMLDGAAAPADALARLNALAVTAPPGSNGVVFTPWLNGERTPVEDPYLRGGWFNVSLSSTRADLARSVFEGIALNARWMKEAVERLVRRELPGGFRELNFIGGGAGSALWCQTMADVLGCTVHQVHDPVLANARGAALVAAVALGELAWADIPSRVRIDASYRPDPANRDVYDRQYRTFSALYRSNRAVYARHNGPPRR